MLWGRNPVLIGGAVRAIILCATAFGLNWSADQVAATMLAVEAILALLTNATTTPDQTLRNNFVDPRAMKANPHGTGDGK